MQENVKPHTIANLRETLWDTLDAVKEKRMTARDANAITSTANAIIKSVRLELDYASMAKQHPAIGLIVDGS